MTVCVPIDKMRHTRSFLNLVSSEGEVIVTNDGNNVFRCISNSDSAISTSDAHRKLKSRMQVASKEVEEGKYLPFDDVIRSLR